MKTFDRHKQNLKQDGNKIYSYSTHVATLVYNSNKLQYELHQHGWWSVTTQRHINYVANYYDVPIIKEYEQAEKHKDELADRYYNIIKRI